MEPVSGAGSARAYLRSNPPLMALVFGGIPATTVFDNRWPFPVVHPWSLLLLAVVAVVVAAHTAVFRALLGSRPDPAGTRWTALGAVVLAVATAGVLLVGWYAAELGMIFFLVPGLALSALLTIRGWRRADCIVAGIAVLGVVVLAAATGFPRPGPPWGHVIQLALLVLPPATDLASIWLVRVFDRLDRARFDADELATTRERVRIAAELHDVQGHSLHAIAMHAELTERLVGSDPEAAARHARTVRTLAADALAETRALVRGYRDADLAGEVRNAAGLLRAAGADASVSGDPSAVPAVHAVLLGPVVREAATNVLRHSDPSRVTFTVRRAGDRTELEVCNDGVPDGPQIPDPHGGTGLAGVRDRIGKRGGSVEAGPDGAGGFRLRVLLLRGTDENVGVDA